MKKIKLLHIVFVSTLMLFSCSKQEISYCDDDAPLYVGADFPIGAAISTDLLQTNEKYRSITRKQFNRISGEQAWLLYRVHPHREIYDWRDYDTLVQFAERHNQDVVGHSLIYHDWLPYWLNEFSGSKKELEAIMKDHIQTIVSRYKGKIGTWIVVNEAFNEDGTLRKSIWHKYIGPSYIAKAYKWAHEADPDAKLFYNDYNLALNRNKLNAVLRLLKTFKENDVPVHGLGCQLHIFREFPEVAEINEMALKVQQNDLLVYYSEIDISLNVYGKHTHPTNDLLMSQKQILKGVVNGYKRLDSKYQYGISFWNIGDADTWIRYSFNRNDWPCMWDDHYEPKPMYCGIKEAL
ncbi:MAG: endo-1,4-beta-xylanase [Bacteroidetes bacterium]|nr:endo-1,4-beta-xylanase [Bacteroidota bacterium]